MTTLAALPVFLVSAQSVLIERDLAFGEARLGLVVSAFFGAAAIASLTGTNFIERLGARRATMVSGTIAVVSASGIALLSSSFIWLLTFLILAGVANAGLQMTSNVTLARVLPADRQGLGYGVKQSAIPFSILIGGLTVPTLTILVGWRGTFAVAAFAAFCVVLAGSRMARVDRAAIHLAATGASAPRAALIVTFVAMSAASGAVNSLGAFLPSWAFEVGLSPERAGLLLSAVSALAIASRLASGMRADRRDGRNLPVVAVMLGFGAIGVAMLAFPNLSMLIVGSILAFGLGWGWPGLLMFAVVRVGRDRPGPAASSVQAGAFVGGASGPLLFGLLVSATNYSVAWLAASGLMIGSAALLLVARRMFILDIRKRPIAGRPSPRPTFRSAFARWPSGSTRDGSTTGVCAARWRHGSRPS